MDQNEIFINKARKIHGDKYDYSKVEYINNHTKVCIICPIHGEFWQTPSSHLRGRGCLQCAIEENKKNARRFTTDIFKERAKKVHGDKYDYSKVEYVNNTTKVCIICPIHGEFWQTPKGHLRGDGCMRCGRSNHGQFKSLETFINDARQVHGDFYDYSKVEYRGSFEKVCVVCPLHGDFLIRPSDHLQGQGCNKCAKEKQLITRKEEFISWLHEHYPHYGISNLDFQGYKKEITLTCPIHGNFTTTPFRLKHFNASCPQCKIEKQLQKKKPIVDKDKQKALNLLQRRNDFIQRCKEKFGEKCDYSKVEYINGQTKVCITCPIHGDFWRTPQHHLSKNKECPLCAKEEAIKKATFTQEQFLQRAYKIHGNKYDYSKVEYINYKTKVCIICPEHGEFWQTPGMHISEHQGCPICGQSLSKGEDEIKNFIEKELKEDVISRDRQLIKPHELDIVIANKNIAIEYNGLRWHSELMGIDKNYHINKLEKCQMNNINLIQIFEDEYVNHKDIVLSKLKHILHKDYDLPKVVGRKCEVKTINMADARLFLNKFHIQGFVNSTVYMGAFHRGELIGVMTFKEEKKGSNKWELNRFATNYNYRIIGVGGKLWSYFLKQIDPLYVKSFADRRWTINSRHNLYTELGFTMVDILEPDYRYYNDKKGTCERIHKFNCRKNKLAKDFNLPLNLTEKEMCEKIGLYKIWDCGLLKYVWKKQV